MPTPPATPPKPTDPELAAVVAAWPDLPPAIRAGVVALVKAATPPTAPQPGASRAVDGRGAKQNPALILGPKRDTP
jgi:hypothetical protein